VARERPVMICEKESEGNDRNHHDFFLNFSSLKFFKGLCRFALVGKIIVLLLAMSLNTA
jgi:hypothetical protein